MSETPEADWLDQQQPARPFEVGTDGDITVPADTAGTTETPVEADEADRADQATPVSLNDDPARPDTD